MKLTVLILLLFSSAAYGQMNKSWDDPIQKGDSLETRYADDSQFSSITDTIPIIVIDENSGWRDMRLAKYFYDSTNELKKIVYRHGQQGYYHFYLDRMNLRKVRIIRASGYINLQYYFSDDDNQFTLADIEQKEKVYPDRKEWYELLKIYRNFVTRYKTHSDTLRPAVLQKLG